MYEREINKLKKLMDSDILNMLGDLGCYIAGGAITSLFTNKSINDIDVYFPSRHSLLIALANIFGYAEKNTIREEDFYGISQFSLIFSQYTEKSVMLPQANNKENPIQFVYFKYFSSPQEIFDTFDFTCCMGAYDIKKNEMVLHPDFLVHNAQKYLQYNPNTNFPINSLLRVRKYEERGYSISKSQMLRIIVSCMNKEIKTWEDFENQIGGMYGEDVSKIFDKTKEFTLEEAISQLDSVVSTQTKLNDFPYKEGQTIEGLLSSILSKETDILGIGYKKEDYKGRYFKWVKEKEGILCSHYSNNFIYTVGKTINGGVKGIFFFTTEDHTYPTYQEGVLLELSKKEEDLIFTNTIIGDVTVERIVPEEEAKFIMSCIASFYDSIGPKLYSYFKNHEERTQ